MDKLTRTNGSGNNLGQSSTTGFDSDILKHIQESFYLPGEQLASGEIRITFMGTNYIPRVGQACNSVFIECGNGESFVFDCGSGVCAKYVALGVPWSRMTRVFLTHLHGDHMSDLIYLYCFGPSGDRKTALHVYGPSGPIIPTPYPDGPEQEHPEEGTANFCQLMQQMSKWHCESFSFLSTGITGSNGEVVDDGYNIEAHELKYREFGTAYQSDDKLVTIKHFPAAHDRDGAISFNLSFNLMNVVFSGDTAPTTFMTGGNLNGATVLIHEMALDADIWTEKSGAIEPGDPNWDQAVAQAQKIIDNSHTPANMLGKILNMTKPQLGVITHCQFNQDTFIHALDELRAQYSGPIAWATDAMVLNLTKNQDGTVNIRQRMGLFSDYAWNMNVKTYENPSAPKYTGAQWSDFIKSAVIKD